MKNQEHYPWWPISTWLDAQHHRLLERYQTKVQWGITSCKSEFSSVQFLSCVKLFAAPWTAAHQASLSITNSQSLLSSCLLRQWCHLTISCSVFPFSSHLQSFPASGSFQMSQFFTSGGQSIGVSTSASVLSIKIQDWFPLGWTGWISLQPKGLSRVFSNTTVQKHQFFGAQLSLESNSYIHTSVQFSSLSCVQLCDPMDYSMPGLPVHHQLP